MCSSFPRPLAEEGDDSVVAPSLISNGNDDDSPLFFLFSLLLFLDSLTVVLLFPLPNLFH